MANFISDTWINSNIDFSADLFSVNCNFTTFYNENFNLKTKFLFQRLTTSPGNIIISPFSILSALYLLLNGTKGNLQTSLAKTLKLPDLKDEQLLFTASEQFSNLQKMIGRSESFTQANRIFVDSSTVEEVMESYRDKVEKLDLINQVESVQRINDWVRNNTCGLISELIKPGELPQNLKLMLIDLMLFKGVWEKKFDPALIFKSKFTNADGTKSIVEYLYSEVSYIL